MVILFVVLVAVLFGVSVRGLRGAVEGKRWPFAASAVLTGLMLVLCLGGVLVALAAGRTTWNEWTAGTPQRETVTLNLLLVGFPLTLTVAVLLLLVGSVRRSQRRP